MTIQQRIKERRLALGMTLAEVAYKAGISESTLSRYETSGIQNMGIDKLQKLADVLKTTPAYLMGWEEVFQGDIVFKMPDDRDFFLEYTRSSDEVRAQIRSYAEFTFKKWEKENENRETPKR